MPTGSPQDLSTIGRMAKQIRKGKMDNKAVGVQYEAPEFKPKNGSKRDGNIRVDCTNIKSLIKTCMDNNWQGTALMLFGELSHDLLYYIRSKGVLELVVGSISYPVEKRGADSMRAFGSFLEDMQMSKFFSTIKELMDICTQTNQIAEKVHLRTLLVMFADIPSLFIPWSPVKISRLLGSGGQRTIFEIKTRSNEYYALRPDTRNKELERMFVCLEALDAPHLFHIFEALDYDDAPGQSNSASRCHLFMPVMMELDSFFTQERLKTDTKSALAMVYHTSLQLSAMAKLGLVHRDVKPANILVYTDRTTAKDKDVVTKGNPFFFLTDFGWSCEKGIDRDGAVGGTKQYRDPYMYVISPHPKHDIWCMGLAFLFLINRITEQNNRATMVRKIKQWQEGLLNEKTEGAEFTVQDFAKWMFAWERMATGATIEDNRRFKVGSAFFTQEFRTLERGCLDLRWEKRWTAEDCLKWCKNVAQQTGHLDVITNASFRKSADLNMKSNPVAKNPSSGVNFTQD